MGTLLPKHNEQYYEIVRDVRQNKGSILKASVDYIRILRKEREKKISLEEKFRRLEQSNRKALLKIQVGSEQRIELTKPELCCAGVRAEDEQRRAASGAVSVEASQLSTAGLPQAEGA